MFTVRRFVARAIESTLNYFEENLECITASLYCNIQYETQGRTSLANKQSTVNG